MKKRLSRSILAAVVTVGAAGAVILWVRHKPLAVEWFPVRKQEALETVLANGRVAGRRVARLALMKNGIVTGIRVHDGTVVGKGDTLILLDNREERNLVAQRSAELAIARSNLDKLSGMDIRQAEEEVYQARILEQAETRQRGRSDTLYLQGSITQAQLDEAIKSQAVRKAQRAIAESRLTALKTSETELREAQLKKVRLQLDEASIALSKTILAAPADGKVIDILVEPGEFAAAGSAVVLFLPADSTVTVEVLVDERDAGRIKPGQRALVGVSGPETTQLDGVVRSVAGRIDVDRGTVTVLLGLLENGKSLIADQTVSIRIITGQLPDALVIDQRFCGTTPDGSFVFVKDGRRARPRPITRTDIGDGRCIVSKGLNDGDTVITAPDLTDNDVISLMRNR